MGPARGAAIATLTALAVQRADGLLNVTVSQDGAARPAPVTGFGTEFVFQTNSDVSMNSNLAAAGSRMCRYPGGTPSDYWLWDLGWVNVSSDHSNSAGLPFRPTTPIELRAFLDNSGQSTCVMVLNQLQKDLTYEVAGLVAHARAGTPVTHIELGNEMYDSTRPDVLAAYPEPRDYAEKMAVWTAGVKAVFPQAKVALDGLANTWDARTDVWNAQVLQNPVSALADAATVHLYPGLPSAPPTPPDFPAFLALVFGTVDGYRSYIAATIPARMEVWVTEWGTWGNANVTGTWLQALWHGALLVLLPPSVPAISVVLPYCATCADPNMPSFVSQARAGAACVQRAWLGLCLPPSHPFPRVSSVRPDCARQRDRHAMGPHPERARLRAPLQQRHVCVGGRRGPVVLAQPAARPVRRGCVRRTTRRGRPHDVHGDAAAPPLPPSPRRRLASARRYPRAAGRGSVLGGSHQPRRLGRLSRGRGAAAARLLDRGGELRQRLGALRLVLGGRR